MQTPSNTQETEGENLLLPLLTYYSSSLMLLRPGSYYTTSTGLTWTWPSAVHSVDSENTLVKINRSVHIVLKEEGRKLGHKMKGFCCNLVNES